MRRAAAAVLGLAVALAGAGCGDDGSAAALEAFRALAAKPDLTYRVAGESRTSGMSQTVEAVIAGPDAATTSGVPGEGQFEAIYKGDSVFNRFGGQWQRSPRDPSRSNEIVSLLPMIASASLESRGRVELDGRSLHRIVSAAPFPAFGGGSGLGSTMIVAMDLLVDDEGRPVRVVLQMEVQTSGVPQPSGIVGVIDLRFSDVGAPLTVEAPSVAPGDPPAP